MTASNSPSPVEGTTSIHEAVRPAYECLLRTELELSTLRKFLNLYNEHLLLKSKSIPDMNLSDANLSRTSTTRVT